MKATTKVINYLVKRGFDMRKAWFKDLALAVTICSKDPTDTAKVYDIVAKETKQQLNTVTFHFSRANKYYHINLKGAAMEPKMLVMRLTDDYNVHIGNL